MIARLCLAALAVGLMTVAAEAQALRWTPVAGLTGPESRPGVQAMLQTPGGAQVVASTGLYRRVGGGPWMRTTVDSLRDVGATAFAIQGSVVYASTAQFGVLRSDDDGRSWRGDGLNGVDLAYVAALPDGALVAIGWRRDVYRKDTDGTSWARVGSVGVSSYIYDNDIVVLGDGTLLMTAGLRLMRSVDRGSTWTDTMRLRTSGIATATGRSVFILLSNGRVERSDDSGATWTPVGQVPATYIGDIVVRTDGALLVSAGTSVESGILRSETGSTWTWIYREPRPYGSPGLFALGPEEPWIYISSSGNGLIQTDPASGAWAAANSGFVRETYVGAVVRAGSWLVIGSGTRTHRTRDGGATWASAAVPGNFSDPLLSLADTTLLLGDWISVLRSSDAGGTWAAVPVGQGTTPLPTVRALAQSTTGTVLAGTHVYTSMPAYGHLYRSTDDGTTWVRAPMSEPLGPTTSLAQTETGTLFSGHRHGGIEGVGGGLARSDDDGATWTVVGRASVVALAPLRGGRLLIGVRGYDESHLYRSTPSGESWEALGRQPGLEWTLFRTPDGVVYLTGHGTGVRRSFDDGTTWESVNDGLGNRNTTQMIADADGRLYVGTSSGLFRSERPAVAAEAPPDGPAARLEAPRPNPVARRTTFAFSLAADADIDLGLYDVLGRRVATVASGRRGAGRHEAAWERGNLASGVYLAVLKVGGAVRTQRVTAVP